MGCMGQSNDLEAHSVGTLPGIKRQNNKNWPTITYFDMYGRGSPIHFQFEHAGQAYNEDLMTNWADRKKDFNGCGLPVVTLPDGSQLAESVPTSIYFGKKFG